MTAVAAAPDPTSPRRWRLVFASGLGLLLLGALALWRSLDAANSVAREAARQAATAQTGELRALLADPEQVGRVAGRRSVAFVVSDGALTLPEDLAELDPVERDPRAELPPAVAALATPGADQADLQRLAELLPALSGAGAAWLQSFLSWRGLEAGPPLEIGTAEAASQGQILASRILRAVSLDAEPAAADWRLAPLLSPARGAGLALRLRDRGREDLAAELEAAAATVAARRAALRAVGKVAADLGTGGGARVVDGHLLSWRAVREGDGESVLRGVAVPDPVAVAGELLGGLASRLATAAGPGRLMVLEPGLYLQLPTPRPAGRRALLGLGAVLAVCGLAFVLGLRATARAVQRETLATRARADFLQTVTHELKTPLASIRLLAERLAEGRVTKQSKRDEHHQLLAGEAARLSVLVENVLDLGRMERGERGYDLRDEAPDAVVREAEALFAPLAQAAGLEVVSDLRGECTAPLDRGAFTQALVNVLENARKYAAGGGKLELRSAVDGGRYLLTIRDHGPGIPSGEHAAVFEHFVRGAAQQHGAVAGVGLGLHLSRRILRAHGGELSCRSPESGPGAAFVFELPLTKGPGA